MVRVAQLVRASDCGSEGRGFESHFSPIRLSVKAAFFVSYSLAGLLMGIKQSCQKSALIVSAHGFGQLCPSKWASCIVVRHHSSSSLSFSRVHYYYIYTQLSQMGKLRSPFISLHLFAIFGFWLTDGAKAHASINPCSEASIKTCPGHLLRPS